MLLTKIFVNKIILVLPDDFAVGDTEEEIKKSSEAAAEILENNVEVRAAIADNFMGVIESLRSTLSDDKFEELKSLLEGFRVLEEQK